EFELQLATLRGSAPDDRWMARADGSRFWATGVTLAPVPEGAMPAGFLKIFRDHTQRKMLIEATRNRLDACAHEIEGNRSAIAVIAHELRGPLSAIGMAGEVMACAGEGTPQFHAALDGMRRNVGFAARLVGDLEEYARAATGKLRLERSPVVLAALLDAAIGIASHREATRRRIDLLTPAAVLEVDADPLRLQQVFVNLVANAIRYTPEPGRIWVAASVEEAEAVVSISDQGIGIAPDMLERIFDMFTQARAPARNAGLGVGLALVKTIVELHGGSVQARSEGLGKGSEFTVRLPLRLSRGRRRMRRSRGQQGPTVPPA
ncbi:MAG TPA: PAS domain-containing sensor histidine kinase, partial [Xanthomonadaceae bacterium]|nr:PAS domain-containing sensor histidine kinase [Xanthomonadaceae bacterium]